MSSTDLDDATATADASAADGGSSAGPAGTCGDGVIEGEEECDLGLDNGLGDSCTDLCRNNVCGDGYLGPGEACDDGNQNDRDRCTTSCGPPSCGDGIVQAGEECDGTDLAGQDCTTQGFGGGLLQCIDCVFDVSSCVVGCGNGVQEALEECDGTDLGASSCADLGADYEGVLACDVSTCMIDYSDCCIPVGGQGCDDDADCCGVSTCNSVPGPNDCV